MNDFKEIELFGNHLMVFEDGKVLVKRYDCDEFYEKKTTTCKIKGYIRICLTHKTKQKRYAIHRLVAFAFLDLDITDISKQIDHIDRNTQDNHVSNLRIVTNQQNQFNSNAKGYSWSKRDKKWIAEIMVNKKKIYLGSFENEEDASKSYQQAKLIHHII